MYLPIIQGYSERSRQPSSAVAWIAKAVFLSIKVQFRIEKPKQLLKQIALSVQNNHDYFLLLTFISSFKTLFKASHTSGTI